MNVTLNPGFVDWLAATGPLTVSLVAVGIALRDSWGNRAELRAREVARKRSQAEKISAWAEDTGEQDDEGRYLGHIVVQNLSDQPVYAIGGEVFAFGLLGMNSPREKFEMSIVPTGTHYMNEGPWTPEAGSPSPIEIKFVDASGQWWTRDYFGALEETHPRAVYTPPDAGC